MKIPSWQSIVDYVRNHKAACIAASILFVTLVGSAYLFVISRDLPSLQQLEDYKPKLASKVYSADMQVIHEYYEEKRSFVPLEEMPQDLIRAVIATEDRRFYSHWGMNVRRFAQAVLINLVSLEYKEGASTLTQQLARQLYLTLDKTITRKLKELLTAIQIERTYTKDEILEMYLNHMNFGHGAYGAQSAALLFFNKDVRDLTTEECAMLVGVLPAPSIYTPHRHPDKTLIRRNVVLASMHELSFLDDATLAELMQKPVDVVPYKSNRQDGLAPYFTEYIRQILQDKSKYGYNLYTDGLSIYTTLDSRVQAAAEKYVAQHLEVLQHKISRSVFSKKSEFAKIVDAEFMAQNNITAILRDSTRLDSIVNVRAPLQAALVSIDPRNGHILAWVGGRDFEESKFNRVVQSRRQPGSAFKPFVYTVAIDNGYPPSYEVLNMPVVTELPDGTRWMPQNYDPDDIGGPTSFREGLRRSLNLVTVRVLQTVIRDPSRVVRYAHEMGIKSQLQPVDALALGSSDVTPLEITSAYGVFANSGIHVEPVAILRVEDKNGTIIEQDIPRRREALKKQSAYIMVDMLKTVIDQGTGQRSRWGYGFHRPAGGKTGTTNDYSDAWFLGFTPQIVTGVWVGFDDFTLTMGRGQDGARTALPIWAPFMKAAHDTMNLPEADFVMPDGVVRAEICNDTKKLANDSCPTIVEEIFLTDFVPTSYCPEHKAGAQSARRRGKTRIRF